MIDDKAITGAAQGIGVAFEIGFGKEGAKIVIEDILDGVGGRTRASCQMMGANGVS
jgi:hypothetical protein